MTDKYQQLEATLDALAGQPCWSAMVRGGLLENGLTLSLGDAVPRPQPLDAPGLTPEQQAYEGAFELSIADCTWRLDSPDAIVTSWSDETAIQQDALAHLVGVPVAAWEITWPGLDLTLHFENTLALRCFCDQTDPHESGENYTLTAPELRFTVGVRSTLTVDPR